MISETEEILKWVATILITYSAITVSSSTVWATKWWAFIGFLLGHIIWSISAWYMQDHPLFVLNVVFIFVDFYAMWIRINTKIRRTS